MIMAALGSFQMLFLVCAAFASFAESVPNPGLYGSSGTDFIFSLMEAYRSSNNYLHINTDKPTTITLESPGISAKTYTVQSGTKVIPLDQSLVCHGSGLYSKGIRIKSDTIVSVHAVAYETSTSDGFLALPIETLATEYVIASYQPLARFHSEFVIIGVEDSTTVSITLKTTSGVINYKGQNYQNGQTITETIGYLQALQIQHTNDLTGTVVYARRPVSVVAGASCVNIPVGTAACDFLAEHLLPTSSWTTDFIVSHLSTRLSYIVRILSAFDGTTVTSTGKGSRQLDKGHFLEYEFTSTAPVQISAEKPILVLQYSLGSSDDGKTGDPFMMIVPGIQQFSTSYLFKIPPKFDNSHANIVIPTRHVTELRLNGNPLSPTSTNTVYLTKLSERFSVLALSLSEREYSLHTSSSLLAFGAVLYGFAAYNSYGFPLGLSLPPYYTNTSLRLVNGSHSMEGQVEISYFGHWRPVCSNHFNKNDGDVICRLLGFRHGLSYWTKSGVDDQSIPHIVINDLQCRGNETDILFCPSDRWLATDCGQSSDLRVDCAPTLAESVTSQCHVSAWNVQVNMTSLRLRYPNAKASDIYFGDNSCKGVEHGELLNFNQGLHDCLTAESSSPGWLSYSNQLVYAFHDPVHPFVIRNYNWSVTLNCSVDRNGTVDGQLIYNNTQGSILHLNTSSKYDVNLDFYRDPGFTNQISGYPLSVSPGTSVYVKVYTTLSDWSIKMRLADCYTTTVGSSNSKYYLVRNGCEVDVNTHYLSEATHETKFVYQMFGTMASGSGQNLHCDAVFCGPTDSSPHCSQTCNP